jgi:streptogramin lyase
MDLDEQLTEAGEQWRASQRAPVADFRRATATPHRGSRTLDEYRGLLAVPIIVGAFLLAIGVAHLFQGASSKAGVTVTQPTTSVSAPEPPSVLALDPAIVQTQALAVDGASLWVTGDAPDEGPATLEHIDTDTGRVLGRVQLGDNGPFQIVVGDTAIWVASQQNEESAHLTKVDPATMEITAVIPTQGDANVAITADAVWVDVNTGNLLRLDPETNKVLANIPLPGAGYSAHSITAGPLGIFLANGYDGSVLRVDPETNTVKEFVDVGGSAGPVVELNDALWVGSGHSVLYEVNPTTGAIKRRIDLGLHMQGLFAGSDGRSLWMRTDGPGVARVDPQTGRPTSVALPAGVRFAIELAADPVTGAVWAASDAPAQGLLRVVP